LTYWVRDPRYSASIAVVPLLPVVLLVAGRETDGLVLLVLAPLTAWVLGFGISADVAYDHTAFALHVATGTTGKADRWGRALPVVAVGTPVVFLFAGASVAVSGRWYALPALLGLSIGVLLVTVGVSSAVSARLLYPVAKPGDSPFKQPQGAAMATLVAQTITGALTLAGTLPVAALALAAVFLPSPALGWATLVVGPVLGVAVLLLGVRWGARTFDRRAPELLQQVLSYA
jgi:ABC-2 type transport system permease protein